MANDVALEAEAPEKSGRTGVRSGAASLIASIALVVWIVAGVYLAIYAAQSDVVGVIATIVFFASWIVIPGLAITILVCAIIALLLNRLPGKIMGALGIVLPFAAAAIIYTML